MEDGASSSGCRAPHIIGSSEEKSVSERTYRVTFEGILQVEATDFKDAAMKAYDIFAKMGAPLVQADPHIVYKYPEHEEETQEDLPEECRECGVKCSTTERRICLAEIGGA